MGKTINFSRQIKILCLFDYACSSGFATVSTAIVKSLKDFYGDAMSFDIVAGNYFGVPYQQDKNTCVLPASLIGDDRSRDAYGRHEFVRMLGYDHYDGVFIIQDPDVVMGDYSTQDGGLAKMMQIVKELKVKNKKPGFKVIYYFPVDSAPMKYLFTGGHINIFDKLVSYTEYGRAEILKIAPDLRGRVEVISHGVDPGKFFQIGDFDKKAKYRTDYFGKNAGKYIICNINRNQFRKDIPATLYGFREFKERRWGESFLYLHMDPADALGWNIRQVCEQLGLIEGEDYQLPAPEMHNAQASTEFLNILYNICDVYLTTTTSEGFGLTVLEAMICGLPVVAPLHTSITEISGNGERIYGLEDLYYYCDRYNNKVVWQCNYEEVAEKLFDAFKDHKSENFSKQNAAWHYAYTLDWDIVCKRWVEIFKHLFGKSNVLRKVKSRAD